MTSNEKTDEDWRSGHNCLDGVEDGESFATVFNRGTEKKTALKNSFTVVLINARSLIPKLGSFYDVLCELDVDLALITETWLTESGLAAQKLEDFEQSTEYNIVRKDRQGPRKGGGVALLSLIHI